MDKRDTHYSRPITPGSPLTGSLYHETSTIDDLTIALANFSRVPSPEPLSSLTCCCGKEDCENFLGWTALRSRLESRLILSAEVGQALLQRHEAYVHRHEGRRPPDQVLRISQGDREEDEASSSGEHINKLAELVKENAVLEKRLKQALVNNEITEISNNTILTELQEARATISRLTTQHIRSVGWETRLETAMKEKDDMQQERDSESHRAKLAEWRMATMQDKIAKLRSDVRRLQTDLEERQLHRLESSESILQDARLRLESLQKSRAWKATPAEHNELTNVLESLVNDNETLKRDNAELQGLLLESHEQIHALQEDVEERRANPPLRTAAMPLSKSHLQSGSVLIPSLKGRTLHTFETLSSNTQQKSHPFEPLTPETGCRPISPADSVNHVDAKWTTFTQPQPRYPPSPFPSFELEDDADHDNDSVSSMKPRSQKSLSFARSRGVQTDGSAELLSPSTLPSPSPHNPRSETSSPSESIPSNMSILLERVVALLNRMIQADALTLTNRLKRQHLRGADVPHLSRSTVTNILSELAGLRSRFRALLEDDRVTTACTRKDLRMLFKLFKDIFTEMGQMRVTLNDIILDPAVAPRVSELALDPSKAEAGRRDKEQEHTHNSAAAGWMAPISKLFSSSGRSENPADRASVPRARSSLSTIRPAPRLIPKLEPALCASSTTVNVEFSGTGVARSTISMAAATVGASDRSERSPTPQSNSVRVMDIFAGAPHALTPGPWVVLPRDPRRVPSSMKQLDLSISRRVASRANTSRGVDVMAGVNGALPEEESDDVGPLLRRTLRRGFSDSSIQSTFTNHGEETCAPVLNVSIGDRASSHEVWPDRGSVLQALSKTVENFRLTASTISSGIGNSTSTAAPGVAPSTPSCIPRSQAATSPRPLRAVGAGVSSLAPNLPSWTSAGNLLNMATGADLFLSGSLRDDSFVQRTHRLGEHHEEFF